MTGMLQQNVAPDSVEVAEVARTLRRGWRAVVGFLALGVFGAVAIILFAPERFAGKSSVLVRSSALEAGGGLLAKVTGISALTGTDLGGLGGGGMETELQVLKSRSLAERVVDSLRLQVRVRSPRDVAPATLVRELTLRPSFAPRKLAFAKLANGRYRVSGADSTREMIPGQPTWLDVGTLTFATTLPDEFSIKLYDQEEAVTRFGKRLTVKKAGGDVAAISYGADNRQTAEAAANALVAFYLEERKTVDRGANQRRVEYLTMELDSVARVLAETERALRRQQEASGVLDAEIIGKVELESSAELRATLVELEVEHGAITQLLAQLDAGEVKPRQLAAHPAFLRGSSLTPLITQLGELEAQRVRLLERRTEADPEVLALDQSIRTTETNFVSTARSYATTLARQVRDMRMQIDSVQRTLVALPAAFESGGRLQREVLRLSQIYAGVQAQLVQARLAAIGEGGFVRQLDFAVQPRKPSFPEPWLTMGIGTVGGLIAGMFAALILGWFGRWLRDPLEIERAAGVIVQRLGPETPLLVASTSPRTLLVVPLDDQARAGLVADRVVRTALSRSITATMLDLSSVSWTNGNGAQPQNVGATIEQLEQQYGMVVVQLPGLASDATAAALRENRPVLLVAPPGRVNRARLESAVQTLRRLQVPCAGVVISDAPALTPPRGTVA